MDRSIEGGILLAITTRQNVQSGQPPVGGCLPVKSEIGNHKIMSDHCAS